MQASMVTRARELERLRLAIAPLLLCAACDSGSSGSSAIPPASNDRLAPEAAVQFPPEGCLTDAARVTLAIAAQDETGIELVRVAGIPAVRGPDSIWRVSVPLTPGFNTLRVETRDVLGNSEPFAAFVTVRRESALWIEPSALVVDPSTDDALVLDTRMPALFRVQPTGIRSMISGPGVGSGVLLAEPRDLAFVASHDAVLVTDGRLDALVFVALGNGRRTLLSGANA